MLKKIFSFFISWFLLCGPVCAGPMVNVKYIHQAINKQWGITVPYNSALQNDGVAANMKYLLTAIDRANEILNGNPTTDYGNDEAYATLAVADTIATNDAVTRLISVVPKFTVTTTPDTSQFKFSISASGTFYIDWGDGTAEKINRTSIYSRPYSHSYATPGTYKIGIAGLATKYGTNPTVSFSNNSNVAGIDGSLGALFPTIGDGTGKQPFFEDTFYNCRNLTGNIPENLFAGIRAPADGMFSGTFYGCSGLTGSIPENLFAGIQGAPAQNMFSSTFSGCSGLTSIPENLFAGIQGAPAKNMFSYTFNYCSGLTSIPENLFAGIHDEPAEGMFSGTFFGCSGLTSIPENLFAGIKGAPAKKMFSSTFSGCSGLTSIPEKLFAGIQGAPAESMFDYTFNWCTGLMGSIPEKLFAGIQGAPAKWMFRSTFNWCTGLTGSIPENLFAGIKGAPADYMFDITFASCTGLTGCVSDKLFAGIDAGLDTIIMNNTPFANTNLQLCPVTE